MGDIKQCFLNFLQTQGFCINIHRRTHACDTFLAPSMNLEKMSTLWHIVLVRALNIVKTMGEVKE